MPRCVDGLVMGMPDAGFSGTSDGSACLEARGEHSFVWPTPHMHARETVQKEETNLDGDSPVARDSAVPPSPAAAAATGRRCDDDHRPHAHLRRLKGSCTGPPLLSCCQCCVHGHVFCHPAAAAPPLAFPYALNNSLSQNVGHPWHDAVLVHLPLHICFF